MVRARAAQQLQALHQPRGGWLALVRHALGMSGAHVAARMGVTRNAIYQAERNEKDGAITIAQMRKIAAAMDATFIYAVVPKGSIEEVIRNQARRKAEARVRRAGSHMALESQSLGQVGSGLGHQDRKRELVRNRLSVGRDFLRSGRRQNR